MSTYICVYTGNPCPVIQPPLNGKVEPVLEIYSFKDQVQIRCNVGFKFVKVFYLKAYFSIVSVW